MKTKFTLTTSNFTFIGTAEQFLAHAHEFPLGVLDAMLTLQLGRLNTYENFGAGESTFTLTITEDHRMSDFLSAFIYLPPTHLLDLHCTLHYSIACASTNHANIANHLALLTAFCNHIVSR